MLTKLLKALGLFTVLNLASHSFAESCSTHTSLASLVKLNSKNEFEGLSEEGIKKLESIRDGLRRRFKGFDNRFLNLGTVHHAATLARLYKNNMFLYGPPGSGKSAVVQWMLDGEADPTFQMQLHQMVTEQAFTGGQVFEDAKLGQYKVNTKGSLADYKVALIDEADKGNPAVLSSLFSLLEERTVKAGNTVVDANTETIFATSNANLPEIFQQFVQNGLATTGPAFLNRFLFKVFAYNCIGEEQRAILAKRAKDKRKMTAMAQVVPDLKKNEIFLTTEAIDWDALSFLATLMIETSPLFDSAYNEFFSTMRKETNRAIQESEANCFKSGHHKECLVYFPSCDFNLRNFLHIPGVIQFSAFVDFLLSDLADDLTNLPKKPFQLGPLSLWRAYLVMTTVGPGTTKLGLSQDGSQVDIDFGWIIDASDARDERERAFIQNLRDEQKRFRDNLMTKYDGIQNEIKLGAKNSAGKTLDLNSDFEFLIMKTN